jgi:hypothetical protein
MMMALLCHMMMALLCHMMMALLCHMMMALLCHMMMALLCHKPDAAGAPQVSQHPLLRRWNGMLVIQASAVVSCWRC